MIIVEQDKTYLVNFNNVCQISLAVEKDDDDKVIHLITDTKHIKKDDYAIIAQTTDTEQLIMGIYSTEKRAKEVLKMIYHFYASGQKLFEMPEE